MVQKKDNASSEEAFQTQLRLGEIFIEPSPHARDRMAERHITEDDIKYCIRHYDIRHRDVKENPIFRVTLPDGRKIKVVAKEPLENPIFIITVAD